jgi:hypothetical protein
MDRTEILLFDIKQQPVSQSINEYLEVFQRNQTIAVLKFSQKSLKKYVVHLRTGL